jgi:hypothetical protein
MHRLPRADATGGPSCMFKHPVAAIVSGASLVFFFLTQAANLIGIVHLPKDIREGLIAMSNVSTPLAYGILFVGLALLGYLIVEWLHNRAKQKKDGETTNLATEFDESFPDVRVADYPAVLALFEGHERDKLIPLLEAEKISAWARSGQGEPPPLRLPGNIWQSHYLVFFPKTVGLSKNQTFIRKNNRLESTYFDVHLNKAQLKKVWPAINFDEAPSADTPIWRAVEHVRAAIDDREQDKCFPTTLKAIRQAALDQKIKLRGRRELDKGSDTRTSFSEVRADIPYEYWKVSTIGALATDERCQDDVHTNPETAFAWGPKGIYEKNRYADLSVNMLEIKKAWPFKP